MPMAYQHIKICARIVPLEILLDNEHQLLVLKEAAVAEAAWEMLEIIKVAQKALLLSVPNDSGPASSERHYGTHQRMCDLLSKLNELD